ncbi:NAD(P)-dependent dehydrogenase (short-subunit alcohol dehydrogenase family) [Kribbella steppae]|uniref:NAD(P)-dependent dehydrogenase (Short-subunit alcohol dehydrogenase family) n=1 Tax=Kribbella steppae TaxID=2512223 RepID=A0A4V2S0F3_9ACTN|nr:SDR family oxidoreductase [Kribbella steppae]TCO32460.1 NAD(P)-dependent dehydrogenase (short-subunit alcohol dehydrogenase family) [Kribbella steppae]
MGNLFDLTGIVAVVTGSSRGIGLAIARALLGQGAGVVINGYAPDETTQTLQTLLSEYPDRVAALAGDVSDPSVAQQLVDVAVETFGRLDHVVCNAGIDIIKPAVDYTPDEWDRILAVNLRGAFLPAQAAARHWIALGQAGSVTMTSSIAGQVGIPTLAPYAASKGGINQLVRTLAAEWATHGIRVNAVAPGYVANIMDNVALHDEQRINTFTPLGRRATVDEIAAPYAFLASPAATYITGAILPADGGYTAT